MRRKRFFSSIAFVLSLVMLAVSGAMFVHSAQQQSASTSLSVTFSGHHVNCSVEGWYQVKGDTQRTALKNSTNGNKVTFSATEGSTEKTLEINNVASENKAILTSQKEYVLFTYKFTNTATTGAYGIEVSLTLDSISNSNLKAVKYGTSSSLYTNSSAGLGDQYTTLSSSSDTVFTDVFIVAGGDDTLAAGTGIKYFYILLEVNDLTLPVSFNPDFTWTIDSSSEVEAVQLATISMSTYGYDGEYGCLQAYYLTVDSLDEAVGEEWMSVSDLNDLILDNCMIFNAPVSVQVGKYFILYYYNTVNGAAQTVRDNSAYGSILYQAMTGSITAQAYNYYFISDSSPFVWYVYGTRLPKFSADPQEDVLFY